MANKQPKPTKQQIAQAKTRAGGNNPVKVTKAGVKRLGKAALIVGSLTPAGRVAKVATTAVKATKVVKAARAAKAAKASKNSLSFKPPTVKNPPKPPTGSAPKKQPHVSERRDTASVNQNPKTPKKDKPMVLPGRGKFTGDIARYNWTGK